VRFEAGVGAGNGDRRAWSERLTAAVGGREAEATMLARLPCTALRAAIFGRPTMAEGLNQLFAQIGAAAA
jgi:hypothetical protein